MGVENNENVSKLQTAFKSNKKISLCVNNQGLFGSWTGIKETKKPYSPRFYNV